MHRTSITATFPEPCLRWFTMGFLTLMGILFCIPYLAHAKNPEPPKRQDRIISTGSPDIIIKQDYPSGDRIIQVKPQKQPEENCNKYTSGQYPIIIQLKPDISNYAK